MRDDRHTSDNRRVSSVNISADEVDVTDARDFGKAMFAVVYRLFRVGSIYAPSNELAENAVASFMELFEEAMSRRPDPGVDVEIRGNFVAINGETLRLGPTARERLGELREVFVDAGLYRVQFERGLSSDDLSRFVGHLRRIIESEHVEDMEAVDVPHVRLYLGTPSRSVRRAFEEVDLAHYQSHLYTRFLVVVRNVARQYKKRGELAVPTDRLRRITGRIADLFGAGARRILGWLPEGILRSSAATHTVHSAIYAVALARRLGRTDQTAGELGAGLVIDDLYRLDRSATLVDLIGREHGSDAAAFSQMLAFDRSLPLEGPSEEPARPRPAAIAAVARAYAADLHGYRQSQSYGPAEALDRLATRAGDDLDAEVVEAFRQLLGPYPPGALVELSNGHTARVLAPPAPGAPADRPTVAPESSPERAVDLFSYSDTSVVVADLAGGEEAVEWLDELYLLR